MANKAKRMDQIRFILSTYQNTRSIKRTARLTCTSRNTVRFYLRAIERANIELAQVSFLTDQQIGDHIGSPRHSSEESRVVNFESLVNDWLKDLTKKGVTRHLLWQEYRAKHLNGYGYSQFCERLKQQIKRKDLTMAVDHAPGETVMIDFAGKGMEWVDPSTGQVHSCEVLVAAMPHSQLSFAVAVPSQKIPDFISGINAVFRFLGGVPKVLLSDNLRSFVKRSNRYEPTFTQLCEQMAAHYGIDLDAARVRKPKDKASVELSVKLVYQNVYAPLRNQIFHSIEEINEAFAQRINAFNCRSFQKRPGCRRSIFEENEKHLLNSLPAELFEIKKITKAKVQRNYHIILGETNNYYSVHFKYVGKTVEVIYTSTNVEIYHQGKRIAFHKRIQNLNGYRYQTQSGHMPKRHQEWEVIQGYRAADFIDQAKQVGPTTEWAIQSVLKSKIHEEQTYKSCLGIIRLANQYTFKRMEAACIRCQQQCNQVNYRMLKNILSKNLDRPIEATLDQSSIPKHDNIRGAQQYQ
jgi:transposase